MFFLLISGVGKSMFQNCCNLFKVYPHIAWTSMCVCMCVSVCVFLHDNSKRNGSRNMKFKYITVNKNNSDKFDIGHCRTKVKVTARLFSPFTAIQTFRSHNPSLVQARKLILSVYVYQVIIYKFYKYRHA